jgi:hypothetical protein
LEKLNNFRLQESIVLDKLENRPVVRFFVEVFGIAAIVSILVLIAGYFLSWSSKIHYSDGFFYACTALAAIGSIRAVMMRPAYSKNRDKPVKDVPSNPEFSQFSQFLARRSLNFRLLCAAVICLAISMIVGQL